jgi:hypothetical protein
MKQHINANTVFNTIMLRRTQLKTQVFVLVEGDTDKRLFKTFFNADNCHIEIAFGRENLLEISDKLQTDTLFIAIADADFWHLERTPLPFRNLFITDTHDMETMMIASPALDKIIAEYAAEDKLKRFIASGKNVLKAILEAGKYLGYLRWLNEKQGLSLKFKDYERKLDYAKFIDKDDLQADIEKMVTVVKNKSQRHDLDSNQLINDLKALFNDSHDLLNVCCGHDLTNILALSFQKAIGTQSSTDMTQEKVESALRLAYHFSYFKLTELFRLLEKWAKANHKEIFIC